MTPTRSNECPQRMRDEYAPENIDRSSTNTTQYKPTLNQSPTSGTLPYTNKEIWPTDTKTHSVYHPTQGQLQIWQPSPPKPTTPPSHLLTGQFGSLMCTVCCICSTWCLRNPHLWDENMVLPFTETLIYFHFDIIVRIAFKQTAVWCSGFLNYDVLPVNITCKPDYRFHSVKTALPTTSGRCVLFCSNHDIQPARFL